MTWLIGGFSRTTRTPSGINTGFNQAFQGCGGSESKPLVEVESGEKTVRYVSVHLYSLIFLGLTSSIHSLLKNSRP